MSTSSMKPNKDVIAVCGRACEYCMNAAADAVIEGDFDDAYKWRSRAAYWSDRAFAEVRS